MKRWKVFLLIILIFTAPYCLVSGCAVKTNLMSTDLDTDRIDFKIYKNIKIIFVDGVNTEFSQTGIPIFEVSLKTKLKALGYSVVENNEDLVLMVEIIKFHPDNKAMRVLIAFGSGRGLLVYKAKFLDPQKGCIATLSGGKSYGDVTATLGDGLLIGGDSEFSLWKSHATIQALMIHHSVEQIGNFIKLGLIEYVMVAPKGKYYHLPNCEHISRIPNRYLEKMTSTEAEALGYGRCLYCFPDPKKSN
jgi:hypothetical protein